MPQFIYQDIYAQIVVYNQIQDMLYTGRKEIRTTKGNEYKINEGKSIGIFKEKYIKIMLIKDKRKAIKELDLLEREIEKYVSIVRKNRKSNVIYENGRRVISIGLIIKRVLKKYTI